MSRLTFNGVEYSPSGKVGRKKSDVAIIGCPFDLTSTRSAGQREAPAHIRFVDTFAPETRSIIHAVDPFTTFEVVDTGDVEFSNGDTSGGLQAILEHATLCYANANKGIVMLGGDHSVSAMGVAAVASKERHPITVFHFDAHPDYWRPDPGVDLDHGTWVRWVIDNGHANRVVQFGVRGWGLSQVDAHWGEKNDVVTYYASQNGIMRYLQEELQDTSDPIYLSIDLDVLDPSYAPGVVFQEPGGITSRELLAMIHMVASSGKMVAGDVCELVPSKDPSGITTKIANRCVMAMLTGWATAPG